MQSIAGGQIGREGPDATAIVCLLLIVIGWFGMNTLVFTLGTLAQPTRFYELLAILRHPALLLAGVGNGPGFDVMVFTAVCMLVLIGPLAPYFSGRRSAWLAGWLPLLLMLCCFAAFSVGGVQPGVAGHLTPGAGALLSLTASGTLACRYTARWLAVARVSSRLLSDRDAAPPALHPARARRAPERDRRRAHRY